jgi:hypothetical protein
MNLLRRIKIIPRKKLCGQVMLSVRAQRDFREQKLFPQPGRVLHISYPRTVVVG